MLRTEIAQGAERNVSPLLIWRLLDDFITVFTPNSSRTLCIRHAILYKFAVLLVSPISTVFGTHLGNYMNYKVGFNGKLTHEYMTNKFVEHQNALVFPIRAELGVKK